MRLAGAILIQFGAFTGPLALGMNGVISGELAGLIAMVLWFCAGLPLSYKALDRPPLRESRPRVATMKVRSLKSEV
jgi:hypothetical protein